MRAAEVRGLADHGVASTVLKGRPGPVRALMVDRREHVIVGDPASGARPHDLCRVQPVLGDKPAYHWGQQLARAALGGRARRSLVRRTRTGPGRRPGWGFGLSSLPTLATAARSWLGGGTYRHVRRVRCHRNTCGCYLERRPRIGQRLSGGRGDLLTHAAAVGGGTATVADDGQFGTDGNGLTFLDEDLRQRCR